MGLPGGRGPFVFYQRHRETGLETTKREREWIEGEEVEGGRFPERSDEVGTEGLAKKEKKKGRGGQVPMTWDWS